MKLSVKVRLSCQTFSAVKPIDPSRIQRFPTVSITVHKFLDSSEIEYMSKSHGANLHYKDSTLAGKTAHLVIKRDKLLC